MQTNSGNIRLITVKFSTERKSRTFQNYKSLCNAAFQKQNFEFTFLHRTATFHCRLNMNCNANEIGCVDLWDSILIRIINKSVVFSYSGVIRISQIVKTYKRRTTDVIVTATATAVENVWVRMWVEQWRWHYRRSPVELDPTLETKKQHQVLSGKVDGRPTPRRLKPINSENVRERLDGCVCVRWNLNCSTWHISAY